MEHPRRLSLCLVIVMPIVLSSALGGCGEGVIHGTNGNQNNDNQNNDNATCPTVTAGEDIALVVTGLDPTLGGSPTASGGTPPYTYTWTGDVTFLDSTSDANPTFNVDASGPGVRTLCVSVQDDSTCAAVSDCVTVTVAGCPAAFITSTPSGTHCPGEAVVLDAGLHDTYLWSTGATTRTITVTDDATYSVQVTDAAGCAADAELVVSSLPIPVAVDTLDVGETGMLPKLFPSPGGDLVYMFFSAPDATVKTFDVDSESWLPGTLVAPETHTTLVRWSGQDYGVDAAGNLHVAWGEEGISDCPMSAAVKVWHNVYDGQWRTPYLVAERVTGDPECAFQNVAMATDGAGRVLVAYQVPTMIDTNPENAIHPKKYRIFSDNVWSAEQLVGGTWKGDVTAGGGAGTFYVGTMEAGATVNSGIALIPPGSSSVTETTALSGPGCDHAARFFVEASGTAHAVWQGGDIFDDPQWHASGIFYNHREGGMWMEGDPGTRLVCPMFFGEGSPDREEEAPVHMAISSTGTRLVVFTYMTELYYLVETDGAWGPIHQAQIAADARWAYPIALGSTDRFLVVWSTGEFLAWASLHYIILDL